ncbi:MAG: hypothetical protein MUE85_07675 [Microscillaceae bacterium]|jgi:HTH-type transcriptional regulator/antitoxin HigA|nr:hypothetical protein [Microscillaceae bacterium]
MKDKIKDEKNYRRALQRIWDLMKLAPEVGSPEGEELDMLATLVEAYEDVHYPMKNEAASQIAKT